MSGSRLRKVAACWSDQWIMNISGEKEWIMPFNEDQRLSLSTRLTRDRVEAMLKKLITLKEEAQQKARYYPTLSAKRVEASRKAAGKAVRSALDAINQLEHILKLNQQVIEEVGAVGIDMGSGDFEMSREALRMALVDPNDRAFEQELDELINAGQVNPYSRLNRPAAMPEHVETGSSEYAEADTGSGANPFDDLPQSLWDDLNEGKG